MAGDNPASELSRSSSAHRRALERPIEPSPLPGWKVKVRGEREDDELGVYWVTVATRSGGGDAGEVGARSAEAGSDGGVTGVVGARSAAAGSAVADPPTQGTPPLDPDSSMGGDGWCHRQSRSVRALSGGRGSCTGSGRTGSGCLHVCTLVHVH
jgi:hypothetical protein